MKLDPVNHCIKTNSKWVKGLIIKPKALKLIEENLGSTPYNLNVRTNFLNKTFSCSRTKDDI